MAYTKKIGRHDQISIDTTDVSNSFRSFGLASTNAVEDVTGFSVTGNAETLPGTSARGFTSEAYYTPELEAIVWPLHANRTLCSVSWQADGLVSNIYDTYSGECYINEITITDTVGSVNIATITFEAGDATGITAAAGS